MCTGPSLSKTVLICDSFGAYEYSMIPNIPQPLSRSLFFSILLYCHKLYYPNHSVGHKYPSSYYFPYLPPTLSKTSCLQPVLYHIIPFPTPIPTPALPNPTQTQLYPTPAHLTPSHPTQPHPAPSPPTPPTPSTQPNTTLPLPLSLPLPYPILSFCFQIIQVCMFFK